MRRYLLALVSLISCTFPAAAEQHWIRLESPNFEMYSSAGEKNSRETLRYFEQIREFFNQAMIKGKPMAVHVRIVAFSSKKEYEPYRLNEFASAYYHSGVEHDTIVLSDTGPETFPVAVHEYVHLVVRHAGLKFPPWLNEGYAELYSTLKPQGDKILVGSLVEGRRHKMLSEKWTPLSVILGADRESAYYNEKTKAGSLYAEGWALTHMLALNPQYRPNFGKFLDAIQAGTPSEQALASVYGEPLPAIEKRLQAYIGGSQFTGVLFPLKLEKVDSADLPAAPASSFDSKMVLAELLDHPGRREQMRARLEELIKEDPKRPEPHATLGYLNWHENHAEQAREEFAKAFDLGGRSPRMLWDYGRLAFRDQKQASAAFSELLKLEPERVDVRLELAAVQMNARQPREVLSTLAPVRKVTPDNATRLFRLMAYAQMQTGFTKEAKETAQRLLEVARTDQERSDAQRLLDALNRPNSRPIVVTDLGSNETLEAPPVLARRRPSMSGDFAAFDCSGPQPKLLLKTETGDKTFLVDDPNNIAIQGAGSGTTELECGPQKNARRVRVEYVAPNSPQTGIDGLLRALKFE
jgi:tetratricopeptide (TPR) repeat protein